MDILPSIAPLRNVAAVAALMERICNRKGDLPGMASFFGRSGLGKTKAASYAANKHRAYYVQVKSAWTCKHLCEAILQQMGIALGGSLAFMVDQIAEELVLSRKPLIIDEADFLVKKNMIEIIRDIYESSMAPVLLIGEENLPSTLRRWERVHNRMLDWVQAQPCDMADCKQLVKLRCPNLQVADNLIIKINESVSGCTRRFCVNLDHISEYAKGRGLTEIDASTYKGRIDTGNPTRSL